MNPDVLLGYSSPFEPFDEAFHWQWVVLLYTDRVCSFLSRFGAQLERSSRGLGDVLLGATRWDSAPPGVDPAQAFWHPFSSLASLAPDERAHPDAVTARAVQFALRSAVNDGTFDIEATLETPVRLGFDRFLLPSFTHLALEGEGDVRVLHLACRGERWTEELRRVAGEWQLVRGRSDEQPTVVCGKQRILVFPYPRRCLSPDPAVVFPTAEMVAVLEDALALIAQRSPAYQRWVERLLRVVIPLRLVPSQYNSETFKALNGAVFISLQDDVVRTADTIIHEVSHDHLHVAETMERLVTSEDEMFFSPPRRTDRPTLGILKAQHAFANVLIFYHLLEMSGAPLDGYYVRGVEKLEAWRQHFRSCLERSAVLTEAAQILWRALEGRVEQIQRLRAGYLASRLTEPSPGEVQ